VLTELPAKRRQIVALEPESDEAREAAAREEQAIKAREAALEPLKEALELSKASDPNPEDYARALARLSEAARVAFTEISKERHRVALAKVPQVIDHPRRALDEGETGKAVAQVHNHFQSGAPSRHPPSLQAETLCRVGRVARPRGLMAAWVWRAAPCADDPTVALTKPLRDCNRRRD